MAVTGNSVVTTQGINTSQAICTAAKTTYNDATNAVLLFTAGANGAVVYSVKAVPRATVTATQCQIFRSPDSGTTLYFENAATMPAYTMAATTSPTVTDFGYSETVVLRLEANERLYAGAGVALAGGIVFSAQGEDL